MKFWQWILSVFSESNGNGSTIRVLITAIVAFVLGVGIAFAISAHQKKISMADFCSFLGSAGTFVVTTTGPIYLLNTAKDVMKNRDDKNDQPGA